MDVVDLVEPWLLESNECLSEYTTDIRIFWPLESKSR